MKDKLLQIILLTLFLCSSPAAFSMNPYSRFIEEDTIISEKDKLVVVWTSGDPDVAKKMVFMYVYNAKKLGWWDDITLLVWGPSSKHLSEDSELQDSIKKMKELGIYIEACKACADQYGVADKLIEIGVNVRYTGQALTEYIKTGRHVITF